MNRQRRTVFRSGNGLVVCLPKTWLDGEGIGVGGKVDLFFNGEGSVEIRKAEGG